MATTEADDRYLNLKELIEYSSLSGRTLHRYLHDPVRPIPHTYVGSRILIKRSEFDNWLKATKPARTRGSNSGAVAAIVDTAVVADIVRSMRGR